MARYKVNEWPKGIIRRDIRVYRPGQAKRDRTVSISPPAREVDLGEYPPGETLRLEIHPATTRGLTGAVEEREFTVPVPGGPDGAEGRTEPVPEPQPLPVPAANPTPEPEPGPTAATRPEPEPLR